MKKILSLVLLLVLMVVVVSCKDNPTIKDVNKPVFSGVEDIVIEKGQTFIPLEGVSVTDAEDGVINVASKSVVVDARSVNVNVEGEYYAVYTAYDSDGNETVVRRKVTVVYTDNVAPDLYGINDVKIVVGDESFTTLKNVQAVDTIDGDLTSDIKVEGNVDIWTLGDYEVKYTVKDKSNNEKTVTRKVTVGIGNFAFEKEENLSLTKDNKQTKVSGGEIIPALGDYTIIKVVLVLKADTETDVEVNIKDTTSRKDTLKVKEEKEYTFYFRSTKALEEATLEVKGNVDIISGKIYYAASGDNEAPVITRKYEKDIVLPLGMSKDDITKEILRGVTAEDEIEGNLTSNLTVNFLNNDVTKTGEYEVNIECKDTANNTATTKVKLIIAAKRDTNWFNDPTFDEAEISNIKLSSGGGGEVTMQTKDGNLVINTVKAGGWGSADSPYLSGLTTDVTQAGYTYMLSFDVKAEKNRALVIRSGLELWESPWMEDFYDSNGLKYQITTDWTTIYYFFYVPASTSSCGSNGIKFEIQLGSIDWTDNENNNITYIDNMHLYLLSNESNAPEVKAVDGLQTTFAVGDQMPDFTKYVAATDIEDGTITITSGMIDISNVNMSQAGTYSVIFNVTDSDNEKTTYTLEIVVLDSKDTEGPIVVVPEIVLSTLKSMLPVKEGTNLTNIVSQALENIQIVDNIDGVIPATIEMIDLDGLNLSSANTGTHTLKIQCTDSSGNKSNVVSIEIEVYDGTAPTIVGVRNYTVVKGTTINPFAGIEVVDGTDGIITLTTQNLIGFDAFLDQTGKVIGNAGDYQVSYKVKDQAGNEASTTAVITVKESQVQYNEKNTIDLLSQKVALEGTASKAVYNNDGSATVSYAENDAWWASGVKFKYTGITLEKGCTYKFIFEASAAKTREMLIYFVDANSNKLEGWENPDTYNRVKVTLTTTGSIFEYEFTVTSDAVGSCTLEVQFGWEQNLFNSGAANTINVKQIKLLSNSTKEKQEETDDLGTPIHTWDWSDATVQSAYSGSHWAQKKLDNGSLVDLSNSQMNCRMKDSIKVVNLVGGYSQVRYFTYTNGDSLGVANTMTVLLGNYYSPNKPISYKLIIIDKDDNEIYLKGSQTEYEVIQPGSGLETIKLEFEEVEVKAIRFIVYSTENGNQYLYCGPIKLYDIVKTDK